MHEFMEHLIRPMAIITMALCIAWIALEPGPRALRALRQSPNRPRTILWGLRPIRTVPMDRRYRADQFGNTMIAALFGALITTGLGSRDDMPILVAMGAVGIAAIAATGAAVMGTIMTRELLRIIRRQPPRDEDPGSIRTLPPLPSILWMFPATVLMLDIRFPETWTGANQVLMETAAVILIALAAAWAVTTLHLGLHWMRNRARETPGEAQAEN